MTSQQAAVLRAFRQAPGRRLTTSQLAALCIVKYSGRMMELRDEHGYSFAKKWLPSGQWEYRLVGGPSVERDSSLASMDPDAHSSRAAVSLGARPLSPNEWDLRGEAA